MVENAGVENARVDSRSGISKIGQHLAKLAAKLYWHFFGHGVHQN